jgi:hypothetical protein
VRQSSGNGDQMNHRTRPTEEQHGAVMALLEAGGIDLPDAALSDVARFIMKKTGGDPAGVLLKLIGLESIDSPAR